MSPRSPAPPHGTRRRYNARPPHRCRCRRCRCANRLYQAAYREARRAELYQLGVDQAEVEAEARLARAG